MNSLWGKGYEEEGTKPLFQLVIRLGFEPKTHSLEGCCSIQLSYRTDPLQKAVQR